MHLKVLLYHNSQANTTSSPPGYILPNLKELKHSKSQVRNESLNLNILKHVKPPHKNQPSKNLHETLTNIKRWTNCLN